MTNKTIASTLLFSLSLVAVMSLSGQNPKIDSLENIVKQYKAQDTSLVNLLNETAYSCYPSNPAKVKKYAQQASVLADQLKYEKGKSESLWLLGITVIYQNPDDALSNFQEALKIAQKIGFKTGVIKYIGAVGTVYGIKGQDSLAVNIYKEAIDIAEKSNLQKESGKLLINMSQSYSRLGKNDEAILYYNKALLIFNRYKEYANSVLCFNALGRIYSIQGNYPLALENLNKGLFLIDSLGDKRGISLSLMYIAGIYFSQNDYDKALDHNLKALRIFEEINDKHSIAGTLLNIGSIYLKTNDNRALEYLQRALNYCDSLNINRLKISVRLEIGVYYRNINDYEKAIDNFNAALKQSESVGIKDMISKSAYQIGLTYFKKKQHTLALKYAQQSIVIATEMKLIDEQKDIYELLSNIYSATQNYQQAYKSHLMYKYLSDSIFRKENIKSIIELEYTYKFEKAKQEIEIEQQKKEAIQLVERKQQQIIIVSLMIGLILITIIAIIAHRSYKEKKQTNIILTKQKNEIEELNEEYYTLNEVLIQSNENLQKAKDTIEERENLLTQITDTLPITISLINSKMDYDFVNSGYAEVYNKKKNDFQNNNIFNIHNKADFDTDRQMLLQAMNGQTLSVEKNFINSNNQQLHYYTNYKPYNYHNGAKGILICGFDITERKRAEQAKQEIEAEKKRIMEQEMDRINKELEINQKSITAATLKLIQNAEKESKTIEQLTIIEQNTNSEGKQTIRNLISEYKRVSNNTNWNEFEILFEKVHSSFYNALNTRFPDLTANERKMCAFLKLNMNNRDIAQITFQSDDALKKARLRLRQKLGIDRETNLGVFIQAI